MCVAVIVKKPVSLADLLKMEQDNPHGAGVAWGQGGTIEFRRGLDAETIYAMQQREEMTYPYLMHYRWATHGPRIPQLTHPFPTGDRAFSGELSGTADQVLIHNGVWHDHDKWAPYIEGVPQGAINAGSDTSVAAYFIAHFPDLADEIPWAVAVAGLDEAGDMTIKLHGDCWVEHEGNTFSNLSWNKSEWWTKYRTPSRAMAAGWDSLDWEGSDFYSLEPVEGSNGLPTERMYSKKPVSVKTLKEDVDMADLGFDDWTDYVRARYGDDIANDIRRDACKIPVREALDDELDDIISRYGQQDDGSELEDYGDPDLISEDYATVNAYLANKKAA